MLLIWLPLNNDLRNIGLSDLQFSLISTNTTHISNYYTNNSNTNGGLVSDKTINLGNKQSMFCWVYLNSFYSSSSLTGILGLHRYPVCRGMGITMKYLSSTTGKLSVNTGNGNGERTYNTYVGNTTLNAGKWYHVGYTYDNGAIKLYVNGVLDGTYNVVSSIVSDYIQIFGWSFMSGATVYGNYKLNGRIRDVRIYDHCLSAKEVKELSKGLILHYKFNESEILRSKCKNITWNQIISNIILSSMATLDTTIPGERKYVIKNTVTSSNRFIYTAGTTIPTDHKAAVYIKFKSNFTQMPYLRYAKASGSYASLYPTNYVADEWCEIKGMITEFVPGGASGILPYSNGYVANEYFSLPAEGGFMIFDLTLMFGSGNEPSLAEFQEMFPALTYQYDTGTLKDLSLPVPDCSGFGYDATPSGKLALGTTSPKYNKCIQIVNSSYLRLPDVIPNSAQEFTISVWIKPTVNQTGCIWNGRTTTGKAFAIFYLSGGIRFDCDGSLYLIGSIPLNTWSHVVCTYKYGGTKKVYINSTLVGSITAGTGVHSNVYATIGTSSTNDATPGNNLFLGYMSDYRIYLTELNLSCVTDLYKTSTVIDNKLNLYCYELSEKNSKNLINKNGVFETPTYSEALFDDFEDISSYTTNPAEVVRIGEIYSTANQLIEI